MTLEGTVTALAFRKAEGIIAIIRLENAYLSGEALIPFEIAVKNKDDFQLGEKVRVEIGHIIQ